MRPEEIFLDIETDWDREITVVGFSSRMTGLVQLVGAEITRRRFLKELPRKGHLYTYNGHSFDCVCIRHQFGIDLRESFDSRDLRWVCQRLGLMGGQKAIEDHIGVKNVPWRTWMEEMLSVFGSSTEGEIRMLWRPSFHTMPKMSQG